MFVSLGPVHQLSGPFGNHLLKFKVFSFNVSIIVAQLCDSYVDNLNRKKATKNNQMFSFVSAYLRVTIYTSLCLVCIVCWLHIKSENIQYCINRNISFL